MAEQLKARRVRVAKAKERYLAQIQKRGDELLESDQLAQRLRGRLEGLEEAMAEPAPPAPSKPKRGRHGR